MGNCFCQHILSPLHIKDSCLTHKKLLFTEVEVLLIMVATEGQAESVLYGDSGALSGNS
jgi:hypothetical protein